MPEPSEKPPLYQAYLDSMSQTQAQRHTCWRVMGYRGDAFPGRWEVTLGSGRSLGPFASAEEAMQRAVLENAALIGLEEPSTAPCPPRERFSDDCDDRD